MKKLTYILTLILILGSSSSFAQPGTRGIYLNAGDFLNTRITHAGKYTHLRLHEFFEKNHLEVKSHDSTFSYLKKDVFGYIDKDGQSFRFYNNSIYPILNPHESILLYRKTSGTGIKNSPVVETYYFSKDAGTEILPLTSGNLEQAFFSDRTFTDILEIYFKNGDDLAEYDTVHKIYKLNRLLEISQRIKNN